MTRLGGWLFRHRTLIPLPLAIALLLLRIGEAPPSRWLVASGIAITAAGEAVRLWAVRHIGTISRTRSDRLGALVASGPFAVVRNPLYLGNIALWIGFAMLARLLWMIPIVVALLAFVYHAIVRWEEEQLEARLGDDYRAYTARVPRWIPTGHRGERGLRRGHAAFSWPETLFSERGTLIAMALGYALLSIKARF